MKIYFAGDHAFFHLKKMLVAYVRELGYEGEDLGPYEENHADDYPDFVLPCAERVAREEGAVAIIGGGSGQGEAMCANRVRGARAAVFYGKDATGGYESVVLARAHNDANILSLGARSITEEDAREAVRTFLTTPFSKDERHIRRLAKF
jgi:ribose 5-phosphate isomerase B